MLHKPKKRAKKAAGKPAGMRVVRDDLWLCQDCMFFAVNGELPSFTKDDKRDAQIVAGSKRLGPHMVPDFADGIGEDDFSSRTCAACNTRDAGARYRFAILGSR